MTQEINLGDERRAENIRPVNPFEYKPVKKHESPAVRNALAETLQDESLSPRTALDLLIHFDDEITIKRPPSLPEIAQTYGFDLQEVPEDKLLQLALTFSEDNRANNPKSKKELQTAFNRKLHEQLTEACLEKIDVLSRQLENNLKDHEAIKATLRNILDRLGKLSKHLPAEDKQNLPLWEKMYNKFKALTKIKIEDEKTSRIFSDIFQEYNDLIDNELVIRAYKLYDKNKFSFDLGSVEADGNPIERSDRLDVEDIMQVVYGRTGEEVEDIKTLNRKESVKKIHDLATQGYLTVDDVILLHQTNNRNISPKAFSRLRAGEEPEDFGMRFGTLPQDVAEEMNDWQARVNEVIQESEDSNWNDTRYQIAAAQLHNQLLDIHPFLDRNGSTSLLFLETIMARRGYKPSEKRDKDFYKTVKKALGNNPVAIGLILYEMGLIEYVPGYFKGKTTKDRKWVYRKEVFRLFKKNVKNKIKKLF